MGQGWRGIGGTYVLGRAPQEGALIDLSAELSRQIDMSVLDGSIDSTFGVAPEGPPEEPITVASPEPALQDPPQDPISVDSETDLFDAMFDSVDQTIDIAPVPTLGMPLPEPMPATAPATSLVMPLPAPIPATAPETLTIVPAPAKAPEASYTLELEGLGVFDAAHFTTGFSALAAAMSAATQAPEAGWG